MFLNWPESEAEEQSPVQSLRRVIEADKINHTQREREREREIYTSSSQKPRVV